MEIKVYKKGKLLKEYSTETSSQEDFQEFRALFEVSEVESVEIVFFEGTTLSKANDILSNMMHDQVKVQQINLK